MSALRPNETIPFLFPPFTSSTSSSTTSTRGKDTNESSTSTNRSTSLVRTGTIGDGSCFFHSVLHALSKTYRDMDIPARKEYVKKIRKELSEKLTKEVWSLSPLFLVPFLENFQKKMGSFLDAVKKGKVDESNINNYLITGTNIEDYRTIFSSEFLTILDNNLSSCEGCSIDQVRTLIDGLLQDTSLQDTSLQDTSLQDEYLHFQKVKREKVVSFILQRAYEDSYNEMKDKLGRCDVWADDYLLGYISDILNRNFYFIHLSPSGERGSKGMSTIYKRGAIYKENRNNIVILWLGESHFEIIGKKVSTPQGSMIIRDFPSSDPLIKLFQ